MDNIEKILQELAKLSAEIKALVKPEDNEPTHSEQLNELFGALAKAQAEFKVAAEDSENPYFKSKYADMVSIIKATRPALTKHGLAVIQNLVTEKSGALSMLTILSHSSGQYITSNLRVTPAKNDIQSLGSMITYLARYSYARLLCVAIGDHSDDDGEVAMIESRQIMAKGPSTKYNPKEESFEVITKEQLEQLEYELADTMYADIIDSVLDGLKIQSLADMPKSKFMVSMKRILEIKALRSGIKPPTK